MSVNTEVSIGDIIAFFALLGSVVMFILNIINQIKTKAYAENANAYNESAKKYFDLASEQIMSSKDINQNAKCDANIVKLGKNKWILKIFNKGKISATDVSFKYLEDGGPDIVSGADVSFPIRLLEPQKSVDYHVIIHMGLRSSSWEYELTWINENGESENKRGVLTLPLS